MLVLLDGSVAHRQTLDCYKAFRANWEKPQLNTINNEIVPSVFGSTP